MLMSGDAAECAAGRPTMCGNQRAARDATREHRGEPSAAESARRLLYEDEALQSLRRRRRSSAACFTAAAATPARLRRPPPLPPSISMQLALLP